MNKLTLIVFSIPLFSFCQSTKMEWYTLGKQHYEEGRLLSAVEELTEAIKLDSQFASAYYYRGCALNKAYPSDGMDTITQDFEKCIALAPDSCFPEAHFYLAYLIVHNDYKLALNYLDKAIKCNPGDYNYFRERGQVKKHMDMYIDALKDYTQAIALNNEDDLSYRYRSDLEWKYMRMYEEAISDFEMEAKLVGYTDYWLYATLLCQAGKKKEAQIALNKFNAAKEYQPRTFSDLNCNRQ